MRHLIAIILTSLAVSSFGQENDSIMLVSSFEEENDSVGTNKVICVLGTMPSYPGGDAEMNAFIKKNLKYPQDSGTVRGNVFIEFSVNEDGSLSGFRVFKGLAESFDNSALEAVKKMPNWIPGKQFNKPIRTRMILPIKFER